MRQGDVVFTNENGEAIIKCPICQSERIETRNYGMKTGGTFGAAAGATAGIAGAMSGAEAGAAIGLAGGPVGVAIGGLFGALMGGLVGAAAGGSAGAGIGKIVDDTMLENYYCLDCDHSFGKNDL